VTTSISPDSPDLLWPLIGPFHPCQFGPGETLDHGWEFQDDSFDHEYGTERVHYWRCAHCETVREMEAGDYDDDYE
jgi:hypothetical protein